jgi:hypothetical protein
VDGTLFALIEAYEAESIRVTQRDRYRGRGMKGSLRVLGGILTLSALLTACGREEENRTGYEELNVTADTSEAYEEEIAAPVTTTQSGLTVEGPLTATGQLEGIAEGAPPGAVTVTEYGEGTTVLIKIDRYTSGTELVASLVEGPCQRPGDIVAPLGEPFEIGPEGFATYTTQVSIPTLTFLDGEHSIRINTPGQGAPEFTLACAELPQAPLNELQRQIPGTQEEEELLR